MNLPIKEKMFWQAVTDMKEPVKDDGPL